MPTPYRIHQLLPSKRSAKGITWPATCTPHGIIKFNCLESPHLVYNEFVALRLAQALRAPVADGVLTVAVDGHPLQYVALHYFQCSSIELARLRGGDH